MDINAKLPILTAIMVALLFAAPGSVLSSAEAQRATGEMEEFLSIIEDFFEDSTTHRTRADDGDDKDDDDEFTLESLKFFIEFNETDNDIGVQCVLGGEPYRVLKAYGPDERKILDLRPRRSLRRQGMSDFFFESAEPTLDEFALEDFLGRFPEGHYEFETITIDGEEQDGEACFTHDIPAGPVITAPLEGDVVDPEDLVISWQPVTMSTPLVPPQRAVNIVKYQVIVTREDPLLVFSADVGPDTTSISVPVEFFDPDTEYELEVLAVEESDNQTISIIFFETDD